MPRWLDRVIGPAFAASFFLAAAYGSNPDFVLWFTIIAVVLTAALHDCLA
jgi:hypothetical protein